MKPRRNDPCPCGSGKKYKKCCDLKVQNINDENTFKSPDINEDYQDEDYQDDDYQDDDFKEDAFKEQAFFLRAINNLRRFVLDKKPHIKEYNKIRKMHQEIVSTMVDYFQDGKFKRKISKDSILQSKGERMMDLLESSFEINTRLGAQGFYDFIIYKTASNMNCITEDFIQTNRYSKPEKIEFLHSMLDSSLGLFEVTGTDSNEGYAYLKEIFTGKEYKITDIGLSGQNNYSDIYLYTRIITYHGTSFGSGLNFIFIKTDDFINKHIQYHKKDYNPKGEFYRFTQLYNYLFEHPEKNRVVIET